MNLVCRSSGLQEQDYTKIRQNFENLVVNLVITKFFLSEWCKTSPVSLIYLKMKCHFSERKDISKIIKNLMVLKINSRL